jgi:hypothetical protein
MSGRHPFDERRVDELQAEAALVLVRVEQRLDHLGPLEVPAELFELGEPEVEAREVRVQLEERVVSQNLC